MKTHELIYYRIMLFAVQQGSCLLQGSDKGKSGKQETEKRKWFTSPQKTHRWKLMKSDRGEGYPT